MSPSPSPSPPILPSELIIEILSLLEVKILIRFRCVSKYWKSLIFNPSLVKLHLERSPKHTHILLSSVVATLPFYSTPPWKITQCSVRSLLENPSSTGNRGECLGFRQGIFYSVASANGLVCLIQKDVSKQFYIQFCNPTLRLRSKNSLTLNVIRLMPPNAPVHFGFGYDDSTDKYKVVAFYLDHTLNKWEGRIHGMGDSCWRRTLACPDFPILQPTGLFVNDSVNWLTRAIDNSNSHMPKWKRFTVKMIFSFDLQNETCKYMLLPDGFCDRPQFESTLATFRGRLCLYYDNNKTHFVLWEMGVFGVQESWTQLLSLSYTHHQIGDITSNYSLLPVCLSENGDSLLFSFQHGSGIIYSRRDDRVERVQLNNGSICHADELMQSLVLPHSPLYY